MSVDALLAPADPGGDLVLTSTGRGLVLRLTGGQLHTLADRLRTDVVPDREEP